MHPWTPQRLRAAANALNAAIVGLIAHHGISWDVAPDAPDTFERLQNECTLSRITVWDGASGSTVWATPRQNYEYRVLHDWHHLKGSHAFDEAGEYATCDAQVAELVRHGASPDALALFEAESRGQVQYAYHRTGTAESFPVDQRAFVLHYLNSDGDVTVNF